MVTTFTFSGRHRQPSRLYNSLGVSDKDGFMDNIQLTFTDLSVDIQPREALEPHVTVFAGSFNLTDH